MFQRRARDPVGYAPPNSEGIFFGQLIAEWAISF
jgi:hypothetical protein